MTVTTCQKAFAKRPAIDLMFRAVCDRTRIRILNVVAKGERCVGDIVNILQLPQPVVSRHLSYLKRAGLIVGRCQGQWRHYSLAPPQSEFHTKLLDCVLACFAEVPEIQEDLRRASELTTDRACCPEQSEGGQETR